jgi:hypothetical protein
VKKEAANASIASRMRSAQPVKWQRDEEERPSREQPSSSDFTVSHAKHDKHSRGPSQSFATAAK